MKYFIYTLIALSVGLVIFNVFQLDMSNLFGEESSPALVGVLANLCVLVVMIILLVSRKIQSKTEKH